MKKVLIFSAGGQGYQEGLQLNEAIEQYKKGNEVTFLSCDESVGACNDNKNFNPTRCLLCKYYQKLNRKKYLPKGIKLLSIKDFVTDDIIEISKRKFHYTDIETLRNIKFHGVDIGLGTISSYISFTRNLDPSIDEESHQYFDKLMSSEVLITLVLERILKEEQYDLIIFHNGRFAIFKPFLNIAQNNQIEYICTEAYLDAKGNITKNYFYNDIPHNLKPYKDKFYEAWKNAEDSGIDRVSIGKSFFERRRNAQGTGDKIYTAGQNKTVFVENWDESKENIVIFNSSEDEFYAVSGDFEKGKVFKSQLEGIKKILEHYSNDSTKHFYLRVHPNLIPVKYSYHTDLYSLSYPNLTVIPANSAVSSYSLLDKADKVITFGSTMGIEATYAHKPSICIGPSFYEMLNVAYHPKSAAEVWKYIDCRELKDKYNEQVLIYGYFFMAIYDSIIHNNLENLDGRRLSIDFFGKKHLVYAYEKMFGSNRLFLLSRFLVNHFTKGELPRQERN